MHRENTLFGDYSLRLRLDSLFAAQVNIVCYAGEHLTYLCIAVAGIVIYGFGVPLHLYLKMRAVEKSPGLFWKVALRCK